MAEPVGIGLGVLALVTLFVGPNGWPARRVFTRSLDVASIVVGFGALLLLWQARSVFRGSVQRGSWVRFTLALIVGAAVTVVTTWLVLGLLSPSPIGSRVHELAAVVALGLDDVDAAGRLRFVVPEWVADLVEVLAAATMIIALVLFLRSARDPEALLTQLSAHRGSAGRPVSQPGPRGVSRLCHGQRSGAAVLAHMLQDAADEGQLIQNRYNVTNRTSESLVDLCEQEEVARLTGVTG